MTNQISQDDATVVEGQTDFAAELAALKETVAVLETELETARSAEQSAISEALELRSRLDVAQAQGRDAAMKYREARLASLPEVPSVLVPESNDLAEIDRGMDTAVRLVSQVREQARQEAQTSVLVGRVPAGAPSRGAPDLSSVSAAEKIRIGLERLSDHGVR